MPFITLANARKLSVPLPPFPEQHRIVAKIEELLTRLDAGVKALNAAKAQLKRYRQSVLKSAFEGKLTAEWREAHKGKLEPASVLLERIKEERKKRQSASGGKLGNKYKDPPPVDASELPGLSEGWVWARLPLLFSWSNGEGLRQEDMKQGDYLVYGGNGVTGSHNKWVSECESIVIGRVGAQCGNVNLARAKSWITDNAIYSSWSSQHISLRFYSDLLSTMKLNELAGGSGQPYVSQSILNGLVVPVVPFAEQVRIVSEIERCFSVADAIERSVDQSLAQSARLRQSILKRAFEGKLVPQDPNDPPASELLERIRSERESGANRLTKKIGKRTTAGR